MKKNYNNFTNILEPCLSRTNLFAYIFLIQLSYSMAFNDYSKEAAKNYAQKCTCILILDVSGSMSDKPITELQKGIADFYEDIQNEPSTLDRLELGIITFGSRIDCVQEPMLLHQKTAPTLTINGSTRLVDGVREGIAKVEARKSWYKTTGQPYYRPWLILMTDGAPDGDQDVTGLAAQIKADVLAKKYVFYALGVQGADMNVLNHLSAQGMPPAQLQGLKFIEFFKWLSASMAAITTSKDGDKIKLPSPKDWMNEFTI